MREDTSRTEADAAAYAFNQGRDEAIDPDGFTETRSPFCFVCQRGTKAHVCGPCRRVIAGGIDNAGGYTETERDRMRMAVRAQQAGAS